MIGRLAQALSALVWLCAAACASPQAFAHSAEAAPPSRLAQALTPVSTPTPTAAPLPPTISLWFPALFSYEVELFTATHFGELVQEYAQRTGSAVNMRLRRPEGLGSIFEMLSSAAQVAPSVIPDVVLLRARDLPRAAAAQLIAPLSTALVREEAYFAVGLALARHQGEFYGIPYLLELQHVVYRGEAPPPTWQALISRQIPYLFPAKVGRGANSTLLSHYAALGGRFSDQSGQPFIDYEPLLTALSLYSEAYTAGSLPPEVLDYAEPTQYWSAFVSGKNALIQVDSTFFLRQRAQSSPTERAAWQFGALPSLSSEVPSLSLVDGWLWAFTTTDPERQRRALALIEWLQEPVRLGTFSQRIGMLPARRAALNTWSDADYAAFAAALLDRDAAPLPDSVNGAAAEALQESFTRLLRGELSAEAAANAALDRVRTARER